MKENFNHTGSPAGDSHGLEKATKQHKHSNHKSLAIAALAVVVLLLAASVTLLILQYRHNTTLQNNNADLAKQLNQQKNQVKKLQEQIKKLNEGGSAANISDSNTNPNTTTDPNTGYLVIKEWGIKWKTSKADSIGYTYKTVNPPTSIPWAEDRGKYDSTVSFYIKPELLHDKTCSELAVSMFRLVDPAIPMDNINVKIGDRYYTSDGSPYACGDDHDQSLRSSVLNEYDFANWYPL